MVVAVKSFVLNSRKLIAFIVQMVMVEQKALKGALQITIKGS